MSANKVTFNNVGNIVLVQCKDSDVIGFISDLKSNLDNFKLGSFDSTTNLITFTCTAINHSSETKVEYSANYQIRVHDKVLIKNNRIVDTSAGNLLVNNLITLE